MPMNDLPVYYPGSSIAVLIRLRNRGGGEPIPLADYRVTAAFYTRLIGCKLRAAADDPPRIPVEMLDDHTLKVVIPPAESGKLRPGPCTVRLTLDHRRDGSRMIVSQKIFQLQEPLRHE